MELLKEGISNFSGLPKQIQEYLRQEQLKAKQHINNIQALYTESEQVQTKEQIQEQYKQEQAQETKRQHEQAIERK